MREIEVLLALAKSHDDAAMMELASRFARKMIWECKRFGHGTDEDMQAHLLLKFIEAVYSYRPKPFSKKKKKR
ncbi:MAG: hypothetical protein PHG73_01275 [Pygmaiobacter sp.]|nr:hypothetical protein [Pygmaiobacter sp.]